ncbi:riboflavin synthase subunit alpha [Achromatium sp. WMS2]|nr:riboflavin synthase subunit alpha [Achromatium sp. WMS2]
MFTGIIQSVGRIERLEPRDGDMYVVVTVTSDFSINRARLGDSIAVNGVCLTVVDKSINSFAADISKESLEVTTLGKLGIGSRVNLEQALTLNTPLGGHLVSGHVDGLGRLLKRQPDGRSIRLQFDFPQALTRYIAAKGSICVDGVSLTVNKVENTRFEINIVPHTLKGTIIDQYREGHLVNLEVDLIARYLERLMIARSGATNSNNPSNVDQAFLARYGFTPD